MLQTDDPVADLPGTAGGVETGNTAEQRLEDEAAGGDQAEGQASSSSTGRWKPRGPDKTPRAKASADKTKDVAVGENPADLARIENDYQ